jgi:hypothetical protein
MRTHSLLHRDEAVVLRELDVAVADERTSMTTVLELIAEVDSGRYYLPAGHSSMFAYCTDHLHLSEGAAYKRIQAARAARQFPVLLGALAEGRLHLSALCVLRPHLTAENVDELVASATHRKKSEVEQLVAQRFSQADRRTTAPILRALPSRPVGQLSPGTVAVTIPDLLSLAVEATEEATDEGWCELSPGTVVVEGVSPSTPCGSEGPSSPVTVEMPEPELPAEPEPPARPAAEPRAAAPPPPEHYLLKLTITKELHDKLREFQELSRHAVPSGDVAQVLERALDVAIAQARKSKFAESARTKTGGTAPPTGRNVPAHVRRAVWDRDRGRCTFVGDGGRRCDAREFIEFDHVQPVARGGRSTVEGVRLRCRAHNQLEAERVFGAAFMRRKRGEKRDAALAMVLAAR